MLDIAKKGIMFSLIEAVLTLPVCFSYLFWSFGELVLTIENVVLKMAEEYLTWKHGKIFRFFTNEILAY